MENFHDQLRNNGDEQADHQASNPRKGKKLHRHNSHQIQQLEALFKEHPHPDENQRSQLGIKIGLESKQIKFWFQNKRTQTKTQNERAGNNILRAENERIQCENVIIQEALNNVTCPDCGGPPFGQEERKYILKQLQLQNAHLKEEHERMSKLLSKYIGKPVSEIKKLITTVPRGYSSNMSPLGSSLNQRIMALNKEYNHALFPHNAKGVADMERKFMAESAASAYDELIRLLQTDEPLWAKSRSDLDGSTLNRNAYERITLGRANHLRSSTIYGRFESSKHSGVVAMNAMQLVHMFLDSSQWVDLFPTIVAKANTIEAIENGALESRHGSLQLMYAKLHILSPLVPSREFYFLRYCQHIEEGTWVIVDVSSNGSKESFSSYNCWRLPSGCMIQDMHNGCSKVTWVEHEQVDDKNQIHRLYRDLVCNNSNIAYGAERWIATLQRICERSTYSSKLADTSAPTNEFGGVITSPEGKKSIMKLCHRMVKSFCEMLSISGKLDFPQLSEENSSGVRVSVHKSMEPGQPCGMVVTASTSLWLPIPPQALFDFFTNEELRFQWDVLSNGCSVHEIARISTGAQPGNYISIRRPFTPTENNMVVLQESYVDASGSMIIYAPVDIPGLNDAISGEDSSDFPILPSGLTISGDGRATDYDPRAASSSRALPRSRPEGSLLMVAYQILVSDKLDVEMVATVNALISSTVQKIKASLNCSNLD